MVCSKCGTLNQNELENCRKCNTRLHPESMKGKIACVVHANREATTSCGVCGNRLCPSCAIGVNGIDYCDTCAPVEAVRHDYDGDYEAIPVLNPAAAAIATFPQRLLAAAVDIVLFVAAAALIGLVSVMFTGNAGFVVSPGSGTGFWVFWSLLLLAGIVYKTVLTSMTGQTKGQQIMGVIVLTPDGHIMDVQTAAIRSLTAVVSALPLGLGLLWMLWDKGKTTWHDRLARTTAFHYEEVA